MDYQCPLFPTERLSDREIEALVSPLHLPLYRIVQEPFEQVLEYRRTDPNFRILTEGETAQWLRPQIVQRARDVFNDRPDVRLETYRNQFQIIYRDSVIIVPKKLKLKGRHRTRLSFSSYATKQNASFWWQRPTDGFDDLPRVLLGYLPEAELTAMQIMVVYPMGRFARFCYLMPDQSAAILRLHEAQEDVSEDEAESRGFEVKLKKRTRGRG